jgi:hypothetical protein
VLANSGVYGSQDQSLINRLDLNFVLDFGDQPLGPWAGLFLDFAHALDQFDHGYEKIIPQLVKMTDQASLWIIKP